MFSFAKYSEFRYFSSQQGLYTAAKSAVEIVGIRTAKTNLMLPGSYHSPSSMARPLTLRPKSRCRDLVLAIHNSKLNGPRRHRLLLQGVKVIRQGRQGGVIDTPRQLMIIAVVEENFQTISVGPKIMTVPPAAARYNRIPRFQLHEAHLLRVGYKSAHVAPVRFGGGDLGDVANSNVGSAVGSAPGDLAFAGKRGITRGEIRRVKTVSFEEAGEAGTGQ